MKSNRTALQQREGPEKPCSETRKQTSLKFAVTSVPKCTSPLFVPILQNSLGTSAFIIHCSEQAL